MKELYLIMEDFLKVETEIRSLGTMLELIDRAYEMEEQNQLKATICILLKYLEGVGTEVHTGVNKLDEYIIQHK